jgi:hypothetical protein
MPLFIAIGIVFVLVIFMFWAIAHEEPPGPADVAVAYESAWDHLDFSMLFDLSGAELRDGMRRDAFVAAKHEAYGDHSHKKLAAHIDVDTEIKGKETALVVTRVSTDEGSVRNNVLLEHRGGAWAVVGYTLRPETDTTTN